MSVRLHLEDEIAGNDELRQRSAALQAIAALDKPPALGFDALARLAAHVCAAPMAQVSLIDGERTWFSAMHGIDAATLHGQRSMLCRETAQSRQVLEVADTKLDPRFTDKPLLSGAPRLRYGAGAPIRMHELVVGTVCVFDPVPHRGSAASLRALEDLALIATAMLTARVEAFQLFSSTR